MSGRSIAVEVIELDEIGRVAKVGLIIVFILFRTVLNEGTVILSLSGHLVNMCFRNIAAGEETFY